MASHFLRCGLWRSFLLAGAALLVAATPFLSAEAQEQFPIRPVRVVVPYPPGGPNDLIARTVAEELGRRLRQPFVIDNRPGATGLTGTEVVAKSPADGYTLLVSASVHVIYPALFHTVPFDPLKDFAPITQLARAPLVLSVNPELKARSLKDLLALAKAQPGELKYASSGNGSATHLAAEAFKSQGHIDLLHVPTRAARRL